MKYRYRKTRLDRQDINCVVSTPIGLGKIVKLTTPNGILGRFEVLILGKREIVELTAEQIKKL